METSTGLQVRSAESARIPASYRAFIFPIPRFVSRADGKEPFGLEQGKFALLWEKQSDGEWRVILDMGNSNE